MLDLFNIYTTKISKCVCVCICTAMRFAALQHIGMKLGTLVGGEGPRFWSIFTRSPEVKGQVKFQVALIELKFGESNAGWEAITKRV